jgi:predicted nucleic acid-binding protein
VIFVLDTNVLSERTKLHPDSGVEDFLRRLPVENVRLSAMVLAEVAQGVENNPTPALKRFLTEILGLAVAPFGEEEAL